MGEDGILLNPAAHLLHSAAVVADRADLFTLAAGCVEEAVPVMASVCLTSGVLDVFQWLGAVSAVDQIYLQAQVMV